jgi:hypothetical protein
MQVVALQIPKLTGSLLRIQKESFLMSVAWEDLKTGRTKLRRYLL